MGIIVESIIQNALTYRCISPYSVFYFTTSVQMKHFQYVIHKPECSIQTQVVILKVLMIITSAVTEPRQRDKNRSHSSTHLLKGAVITLFFQHFHYVHLTTCVRLEEIIYYQYSHLLFSPVQFHRFLYNFIPVVFLADKVSCLILHSYNHFWMVTGILQFFSQVLYI